MIVEALYLGMTDLKRKKKLVFLRPVNGYIRERERERASAKSRILKQLKRNRNKLSHFIKRCTSPFPGSFRFC